MVFSSCITCHWKFPSLILLISFLLNGVFYVLLSHSIIIQDIETVIA